MKEINCLVIDSDSTAVFTLFKTSFMKDHLSSISIRQALSVDDAKAKLRNEHFQIIFLETVTEKINPIEFIKYICIMAPFSKLIVLSKNSSYDSVRNAFLSGASDYLIKPIDDRKLAETIFPFIKNYKFENPTLSQAKFIANAIVNNDHIPQYILNKYHDNHMLTNKFHDDIIQKYINSLVLILTEMPRYSLDISNNFLARILSEWIVSQPNCFEAFEKVLRHIQLTYQQLFFPQVDSEIVRAAISIVLTKSVEIKTVKYVAEKLFLNQSHLSVTFKSHTGISLSEYITRVKMYGAMMLLFNVEIDIHHVMNILGYKDEQHFNKNFKKHCGISIFEYSKKYKKYNFIV